MREIATFEAKCGNCGRCFSHPSLGDLVYGEVVLCSLNGSHYATASAFTEFCERVSALIRPEHKRSYWSIVASLADPISDQPLSSSLRCPHCASAQLEYWDGKKLGVMQVPEATFRSAMGLSPDELERKILEAGTNATC
jgi:hypothetical protein